MRGHRLTIVRSSHIAHLQHYAAEGRRSTAWPTASSTTYPYGLRIHMELAEGVGPAADDLPVVDTHQHMWYPSEWKCPWLSDPACASINREFSMVDYVEAMAANNVVKTVFLETEDLEKETSFVGKLCADPAVPVCGAVVGASLDSPDFRAYIDRARAHAFVKGVRDVMHSKERGFCLRPVVLDNIRHLGECGLSCDICIQPDQLLDCAKMVRRCRLLIRGSRGRGVSSYSVCI